MNKRLCSICMFLSAGILFLGGCSKKQEEPAVLLQGIPIEAGNNDNTITDNGTTEDSHEPTAEELEAEYNALTIVPVYMTSDAIWDDYGHVYTVVSKSYDQDNGDNDGVFHVLQNDNGKYFFTIDKKYVNNEEYSFSALTFDFYCSTTGKESSAVKQLIEEGNFFYTEEGNTFSYTDGLLLGTDHGDNLSSASGVSGNLISGTYRVDSITGYGFFVVLDGSDRIEYPFGAEYEGMENHVTVGSLIVIENSCTVIITGNSGSIQLSNIAGLQ